MLGQTFHSKSSGPMEVIEYTAGKEAVIKFLNTGTVHKALTSNIRKGMVKDPYAPVVYGIGYVGQGEYSPATHAKCYAVWKSILGRCYSSKVQVKNPTYVGCTVDAEWHSFQNFAEWFTTNFTEGMHIDKDIIEKGNTIYGPSKCKFVTQAANNLATHVKSWKFLDPDGNVHEFCNLTEFSKQHNLSKNHMSSVHSGNRPHHKQWRKA